MNYSAQEVKQFVEEEDVKFIRLAMSDVFGTPKNISIMSTELERAFRDGIAADAWAIPGFEDFDRSDIFLHPDPDTLAILPWRPEHGRVVRMFSDITWPDGTPFECDSRRFLSEAVKDAAAKGLTFRFGTEQEFYLFSSEEEDGPGEVPYDSAGYMDIGPFDRGENIRREICMTLEDMGIRPESSHHEEGPGQNEIDFRYCEPVKSADDAMTFRDVVSAIASRNGVRADFSPKPLEGKPGNGMHINFSVSGPGGESLLDPAIAGILRRVREMTIFLNRTPESYKRLGGLMAPGTVTWGRENRSVLIRVPAASGKFKRGELRSPDPLANPYLAYGLMIRAAMEGIEEDLPLPAETCVNLYRTGAAGAAGSEKLPGSLEEAARIAKESGFIRECVPEKMLNAYLDAAEGGGRELL